MKPNLPLWRSLLYVPANVEKYVDKAHTRGADVVVRVNSPYEITLKDLEFAICGDVEGIAITKTQNADHVRRIDECISGLEAKRGLKFGHTRLIATIETPAAYFQMPEIARASPRLVAMNTGGEDFALEAGMEPTEETLPGVLAFAGGGRLCPPRHRGEREGRGRRPCLVRHRQQDDRCAGGRAPRGDRGARESGHRRGNQKRERGTEAGGKTIAFEL